CLGIGLIIPRRNGHRGKLIKYVLRVNFREVLLRVAIREVYKRTCGIGVAVIVYIHAPCCAVNSGAERHVLIPEQHRAVEVTAAKSPGAAEISKAMVRIGAGAEVLRAVLPPRSAPESVASIEPDFSVSRIAASSGADDIKGIRAKGHITDFSVINL